MTDPSSAESPPSNKRASVVKLVLTAAVSAAFTVGAGYLTFRLTTREPKLAFEFIEGPSLTGAGNVRRIYVVQIKNTGRREVEDFFAGVHQPEGRLQDIAVSRTPGLQISDQRDSTSFEIRAPFFNPTDTLAISFLTSATTTVSPTVVVRGRGIRGQRQEPGGNRLEQGVLPALTAAAAASLLIPTALATFRLRRRREADLLSLDTEPPPDHDPRRILLIYVLRAAGLDDLAERVRAQPRDWWYRELADEMLLGARSQKVPSHKAVAVLAALLKIPEMSPATRGIVIRGLKALGASASILDTVPLAKSATPNEVRDAIDGIITDLLIVETSRAAT